MDYNQSLTIVAGRMSPAKDTRPDSSEAIGARLKLLRFAYSRLMGHDKELSQSAFARLCGIGIQAWHNAEVGYARIGLDNAIRVRSRTGAGLEYIYFDRRSDLPHNLAVEVAEVEKVENFKASKRASK